MGKAWGESAGEAVKNKLDYIKFEFGTNKMRMVGDILPRYAYWKRLNDNNIPVECLAFDREQETFTNIEKDWFKHYFPKKENGDNMTCSWSYVIRVIDPKDGKIKLCGLKKKLFEQIQDMAKKHLGDPTDPDTGWEIVFEKKKTGPMPFNVEYTLDQMECKKQPLTDEQKAEVAEMPPIDEILPRPTADQQHEFIKKAWLEPETKEEDNVDPAAAAGIDEEDVPF